MRAAVTGGFALSSLLKSPSPCYAVDEPEGGESVPAPASPPAPRGPSAFDFNVPFRGEPEEITPFLGKVTLVVNVKFDDPETTDQMPALQGFVEKYSKEGLNVLAFPTDQGWFEADDSATLRLKFKQVFNFGQYPTAMVFDKADLLGSNSLPFYAWLTRTLANPWGINRLVFNYEKFLLDKDGIPLRRYPRKFPVGYMEEDLKAALAGRPLAPPSRAYVQAWEDAKREATKSEYAFKPAYLHALPIIAPIALKLQDVHTRDNDSRQQGGKEDKANGMAATVSVLNLEELPTWPLPPPSPPALPPYPPPNRQLNASTHLECNFETGIDMFIKSEQAVHGAQHRTDSQMQCCALCAMKRSCKNFVYMPDTRVCVLIPPVEELIRVNNPGTVGGT
ncbi:MAG: hypothetical protein SGPRY_013891, partial [Prymnesium sp.]